jgi:hypothetical protein
MDNLSIKHIVPADIPRVAHYLEIKSGGVYSENDWSRILQWIWISNPNIEAETILGWIIIDDEENIHGVLGNIAAKCLVNGIPQKSYWATSWFVDEDARTRSLELFMNYVKQGGVLMSNTPNASVEKMLVKAFKYQRADSLWFHGSFLFPLHPLKDYLQKGNTNASLVKRTAVMGVSLLLKIPQAFVFLRHGSNKIFQQLSAEPVQHFSEGTDEWFKEFSSHQHCTLIRSSAMYQWIFLDPNNKAAFSAFEIKYHGKILGYMVFKTKYNATTGFHYMELVDEALLPVADDVMKQVIAKTYYAANKNAGRSTILIMRSNHEKAREAMRKLLGIPVKKVEKTYFKQSLLKPGDQPFLTSLDGDSIFF